MKIEITKRQQGNYTFFETEVLGTKVTLSKALIDRLTKEGRLKRMIDTDEKMHLVATSKTAENGKIYTNIYLTDRKVSGKKEDDLPI